MTRTLLALVALAPLAACGGPRFEVPPQSGAVAPVLGGYLHVLYRQPLRIHTDFDEESLELATPVAHDDTVYVGSSAGVFYALDGTSGRARWAFPVGNSISSRPLVDGDTVYFGADDGTLYALDRLTGKKRWSYGTKAPVHQAPSLQDGVLYLANADGHVVALDAATGRFEWQYQREPPDSFTIHGEARPLRYHDRVYAGFHDGYLVALAASTGDVLWARPLGADKKQFVDVNTNPEVVDGVLYAGSYAVGLYALGPDQGGVRWQYTAEGVTTPVVVPAEGRIYLTSASAGLVALDLAGHVLYAQSTQGAGDPSPPVLWGPYVVLSTSGAGLYFARRADGMLLQHFNPGSGISGAPAVDGNHAFVLSNWGFLYALDLVPRNGA